jgi:polar amino acid transport system ATP-binding protein
MSLVEITDVTKNFGTLKVLDGISLNVERGEIIAIIGRSGSGKSTLLRCINGLEPIQAGRIVVDGVMVNDPKTDLRRLRQRVGIVFQSFNLFPHLSVARNITLAPTVAKGMPEAQALEIAHDVLRRVGLEDKLAAYPDQLSGGQQQRVAIARSRHAAHPDAVRRITSALDPELTGEVIKVLEDMARSGMTMLLVTHEMGFARRFGSRVVFMHGGRIHEQGRPRTRWRARRRRSSRHFLAQYCTDQRRRGDDYYETPYRHHRRLGDEPVGRRAARDDLANILSTRCASACPSRAAFRPQDADRNPVGLDVGLPR